MSILDCTQHHASAAPCMGLTPKVGDVGVFCAAETFCLVASLRYSFTGAWLQAFSFCLENLLDTAMNDEWQ